jgi:hypothetical protein
MQYIGNNPSVWSQRFDEATFAPPATVVRRFLNGRGLMPAAQNMLSLTMAHDPTMSGFRILAVHPGQINTGMSGSASVMTPTDAADRFAQLIERRNEFPSSSFHDTSGDSLPW